MNKQFAIGFSIALFLGLVAGSLLTRYTDAASNSAPSGRGWGRGATQRWELQPTSLTSQDSAAESRPGRGLGFGRQAALNGRGGCNGDCNGAGPGGGCGAAGQTACAGGGTGAGCGTGCGAGGGGGGGGGGRLAGCQEGVAACGGSARGRSGGLPAERRAGPSEEPAERTDDTHRGPGTRHGARLGPRGHSRNWLHLQ